LLRKNTLAGIRGDWTDIAAGAQARADPAQQKVQPELTASPLRLKEYLESTPWHRC
jgi:hypothetical protein